MAVEREDLVFDVRSERICEHHPLHGRVDRRTQRSLVDGPFREFFNINVEQVFWR
jgi:hypothetical protein